MTDELLLSQPSEQGKNKLFAVEKLMCCDLLCIMPNATVREALAKMDDKDYSQLPITSTGAGNGDFIGILSHKSIAQAYSKWLKRQTAQNVRSHLLEEPVISCKEEAPKKLKLTDDVYKALELLKDGSAIVVTDGNKPRGIITDFDVSQFLYLTTKGMLKVEEVEREIDNLIVGVFRRPYFDAKVKGKMDLGKKMDLLKKCKSSLDIKFGSANVFDAVLRQVIIIRNHIAHFHDTFDSEDHEIMVDVLNWLQNPHSLGDAEIETLRQRVEQNNVRTRRKLSVRQWLSLKSGK